MLLFLHDHIAAKLPPNRIQQYLVRLNREQFLKLYRWIDHPPLVFLFPVQMPDLNSLYQRLNKQEDFQPFLFHTFSNNRVLSHGNRSTCSLYGAASSGSTSPFTVFSRAGAGLTMAAEMTMRRAYRHRRAEQIILGPNSCQLPCKGPATSEATDPSTRVDCSFREDSA